MPAARSFRSRLQVHHPHTHEWAANRQKKLRVTCPHPNVNLAISTIHRLVRGGSYLPPPLGLRPGHLQFPEATTEHARTNGKERGPKGKERDREEMSRRGGQEKGETVDRNGRCGWEAVSLQPSNNFKSSILVGWLTTSWFKPIAPKFLQSNALADFFKWRHINVVASFWQNDKVQPFTAIIAVYILQHLRIFTSNSSPHQGCSPS